MVIVKIGQVKTGTYIDLNESSAGTYWSTKYRRHDDVCFLKSLSVRAISDNSHQNKQRQSKIFPFLVYLIEIECNIYVPIENLTIFVYEYVGREVNVLITSHNIAASCFE